MATRRRVLVTNGTTDPAVAAARSLTAAGFEVVTADFPRAFGLRSRFATAHYSLPRDSQEASATALLELTRRCRPHVLLPLGTGSVNAACRYRSEYAALTALNVPPLDAFFAAYVKSVCMAECSALGIPCPHVYSLDRAEATLEGKQAGLLVVKPDFDAGAAGGVHYVSTLDELRAAVDRCTSLFGSASIQEYIPGGSDAMKTVVVLFGPDGRLAAAFTTQKVRQWPPIGGVSAASCSTSESRLVDLMVPFFQKWLWRGAAEVELKFDARDGLHKVIEINPRFPGYLRFAGHCGLDLPLLAVRLALGDTECPPPLFAYQAGAHFVSPVLFLRSVLFDLRHDTRVLDALQKARRQLRGTAPLLKTMCSDPLPMIGRILNDYWSRQKPTSVWPMRCC
jgi:predicted ATP-grasp superfamily ATP-dependent carboligase